MRRRNPNNAFGLVAGFTLLPLGLVAQDVDSIRQSYLIASPPTVEFERTKFWISPGSSSGTPTAYGAEFGDIFFGVGFQARTRYSKDYPLRERVDGAVDGGLGLGSPDRLIGIELVVTSFSTVRRGFFRKSSFSFKIHRSLPANLAIAYGWEDAIHSSGIDSGSSMYGVVTACIRNHDASSAQSVTLSAGIGNGRFQSEKAFSEGRHGVNAFGSVGLQVARPVSIIADWTGQDLTLGASIVPFSRIPFYMTPAFADVTGTAGDGARFVMGAGLDFNVLKH